MRTVFTAETVADSTNHVLTRGPIRTRRRGGGCSETSKMREKVSRSLKCFFDVFENDLHLAGRERYFAHGSLAPSGQSTSLCPVHRQFNAFHRHYHLVRGRKAVKVVEKAVKFPTHIDIIRPNISPKFPPVNQFQPKYIGYFS